MIVLVGRCGLERLAEALRARGEAVAVMAADAEALRRLAPELVYADLFDAAWSVPLVAAAAAGLGVEPRLELAKATLAALHGLPLVLRAPRRPPAAGFGLEAGLPPGLAAVFSAADTLLVGQRVVDVAGLWARHGVLDDGVRFGAGHGEAEHGALGTSRLTGQSAAEIEADAVLAWRAARRGNAVKAVVVDLDGVLVHGELAAPDFEALNPAWAADGGDDESAWWRAPRGLHLALRVCRARGLALALCTRNDPGLVFQAFRRRARADSPWSEGIHSALLDVTDFDVVEAGFGPKSAACRRIAARLGVRPDSLVFLDDSGVERAEVEANGGGVRVLGEEVAAFAEALLTRGGFFPWARTAEQGLRGGSWRSVAAVAEVADTGEGPLLTFLAGLQLEVELRVAQIADTPRVEELVARSTQLRLTGAPLPTPLPSEVWVASCRDRIADHGLVAVAWFVGEGEERRLGELAISCRVLPHRIAGSVLAALRAVEPGAAVVRVDTGRNAATIGLVEEAARGVASWVRVRR